MTLMNYRTIVEATFLIILSYFAFFNMFRMFG